MSEEQTESTELVNYDEMLAQMAKAATAVERPSTSNISFKSGMVSYNKDPVPGNKLDCIIIASTHANMYYEGKYDPDDIKNPVCYAYSEDGENMVPHPKSSKPQHTDCATCPMNQWESAESGRGKACKNSRILGIIPASTKPEDIPTAEVAVAKLPVTSVKAWGTYVNKLATLFNRPPLGVITTLGTQPDMKTQFKVTFDNKELVDVSMLRPLIEKIKVVKPLLEKEYDPNVEQEESEDDSAKKAKRNKKLD